MLIEMAIADAYAIAWEFTDKQTAANDLSGFYQHPTYAELKPGQYTDDTQRAIGNILALTSDSKRIYEIFNPRTYAEAYIQVYRQDPREGYSRGYQRFLSAQTNADDFIMDISRTKASNGAVMGAAPLGFLPEIPMIKLASTIQAVSTHHMNAAIHAQLVALSTHFFLRSYGEKETLQGWLMNHADWEDNTDESYRWAYLVESFANGKKTTIKASSISAYMVYAVTMFGSLSEIIRDAVERGGDTDSAAAVAVAVASMSDEITNDLPEHLYRDLDAANPGFGLEYLGGLEERIRNIFG